MPPTMLARTVATDRMAKLRKTAEQNHRRGTESRYDLVEYVVILSLFWDMKGDDIT